MMKTNVFTKCLCIRRTAFQSVEPDQRSPKLQQRNMEISEILCMIVTS